MKISRLSFAALAFCALLAATAQPAHAEPAVPDATAAVLDHINDYRARHSAPPLAADAGLAQGAQEWAERGVLQHSPREVNGGVGENLYIALSSDPGRCDERRLRSAVDMWYHEMLDYDFRTPSPQHTTHNFTQLVWKSSERIGIGIAHVSREDSMQGCMVVARFDPPGNYVGRYEENVLPPQRG
ncbi:CAP family protein [Nocardiopsis sp. LOL_012]|uniref:CAP family protein n=1 Tax=Nocardiopsis sp. LOL_012 TaxID=3345409 RepID=UPI003A8A3C5D